MPHNAAQTPLPSLFISHGAPNIVLQNAAARDFMAQLGADLPRPPAIVVITAHWEVKGRARISAAAHPATIHDFGNFDPRLFTMQYPAPGNPALAETIATLLEATHLPATLDPQRGFDHGTWIPLLLAYPAADIPVVQISIDPAKGPAYHTRLGAALAPLRQQGALIIGSGSMTHNLYEFGTFALAEPAPDWVEGFAEWMHEALTHNRRDDLLEYRTRAPNAVRNHPTDEHLLPLFAAMGAGGEGAPATRLHHSHRYGILAMDSYAFG